MEGEAESNACALTMPCVLYLPRFTCGLKPVCSVPVLFQLPSVSLVL